MPLVRIKQKVEKKVNFGSILLFGRVPMTSLSFYCLYIYNILEGLAFWVYPGGCVHCYADVGVLSGCIEGGNGVRVMKVMLLFVQMMCL